ncbi:MAG TPA: hypothetical protein VHT00_07610 [Stellaceae bacterium]|nr:hypothetical protein [Stellaceae bacterium]
MKPAHAPVQTELEDAVAARTSFKVPEAPPMGHAPAQTSDELSIRIPRNPNPKGAARELFRRLPRDELHELHHELTKLLDELDWGVGSPPETIN